MNVPLSPVARKVLESLPLAGTFPNAECRHAWIAQEICAAMISNMWKAMATPTTPATLAPPAPTPQSKSQGFSGSMCGTCGGSRMVRSGTCEVCVDCGSTSGGCA